MSLVPTFVKCVDGAFYKNLVYKSRPATPDTRPGRDWFVCFDDDEPVEVVIRTHPGQPSVGTVIVTLGLPVKSVKASGRGVHMRSFNGTMRNAVSYFLTVEDKPFPEPWRGGVDTWDSRTEKLPRGEGVFYGLGIEELRRGAR